LGDAKQEQVELAKKIRIDSTVIETTIHAPTESSLLWECVRVMLRLLEEAKVMPGPGAPAIEFCDHRRLAKKRARAIIYMRGKEKNARLYRDLIKATTNTLGYLERAEMV